MISLTGLYNLKLAEYKRSGLREEPCKLLAMLLLSEKDSYTLAGGSSGQFYENNQKRIDEKIAKVEKDFDITKDEISKYIDEKGVSSDDYDYDRIWFVFCEGFNVLQWGLMYREDKSPEELYTEYFNDLSLLQSYDIEQKAIANNVQTTKLDILLNRILENPSEFYKKISDELTPNERLFILENLENKSCSTCLNASCRVESHEKIGLDELGNPQGSSCIGWFNSELIGKCKIFRITNINNLK